jgi:hypothetical protein
MFRPLNLHPLIFIDGGKGVSTHQEIEKDKRQKKSF